MPRIARIVVPGEPHHIIQRGNRRLPTFFKDDDYIHYLESMRFWCDKHEVEIWAYCLMTNHVHLIATPKTEQGLSLAIGEAHKRYTCRINKREKWTGHLWQGRFSSFAMDEKYLIAAARYVERNPVRAGMVPKAADYRWSSARAHLTGKDDVLVKTAPLLSLVDDWEGFLAEDTSDRDRDLLRGHGRTGRPLGGNPFFDKLQSILGKDVRPKKPGPRKRIREVSP